MNLRYFSQFALVGFAVLSMIGCGANKAKVDRSSDNSTTLPSETSESTKEQDDAIDLALSLAGVGDQDMGEKRAASIESAQALMNEVAKEDENQDEEKSDARNDAPEKFHDGAGEDRCQHPRKSEIKYSHIEYNICSVRLEMVRGKAKLVRECTKRAVERSCRSLSSLLAEFNSELLRLMSLNNKNAINIIELIRQLEADRKTMGEKLAREKFLAKLQASYREYIVINIGLPQPCKYPCLPVPEPRKIVKLIPEKSFRGLILSDIPKACKYTLASGDYCVSQGYIGYNGGPIFVDLPANTRARVYGYCDYEGTKVPMQSMFVVGTDLVYYERFNNDPAMPQELWQFPKECQWRSTDPTPDNPQPRPPKQPEQPKQPEPPVDEPHSPRPTILPSCGINVVSMSQSSTGIVPYGGKITIAIQSTNADEASLNGEPAAVPYHTKEFTLFESTPFYGTASRKQPDGSIMMVKCDAIEVTVAPAPKPTPPPALRSGAYLKNREDNYTCLKQAILVDRYQSGFISSVIVEDCLGLVKLACRDGGAVCTNGEKTLEIISASSYQFSTKTSTGVFNLVLP